MDPLAVSPETRAWFRAGVRRTDTLRRSAAGPRSRRGGNALIQAPTGLGQDARRLPLRDRPAEPSTPGGGLRLLYVSPLKALNYDIERNLRRPLAGLGSSSASASAPATRPQKERAAMLREAARTS